MKYALILVSFISVFLFNKYLINKVDQIEPVYQIDTEELLDIVQEWRVDNNYPPYLNSDKLCQVAEKRLNEVDTDWSHNGFYDEVSICGDELCTLGENLAKNYVSEKEILAAWLNSHLHKDNLVDDFEYTCIRSDGRLVVQIFGF